MKRRQPHLNNSTLSVTTPNPNNEIDARVSGTGLYFDDNDKTHTAITFTLDFERNSTSDGWLLINCYGAPS
jgi:hypothetical protein